MQENFKVGIITFHNAINYGALLQTYALQKSIINMEKAYATLYRTKNKIACLV